MATRQQRRPPARAQRVPLPKALAESPEVVGSDYASAYELPVPGAGARFATPEQWGRAVFEGAPAAVRGLLVVGWTQVLRLRMGARPAGGHILGWRMAGPLAGNGTGTGTSAHDFDSLVLEGRSPLLAAWNVVLVKDASVLWATAVRFASPTGRVAWRAAQPVHQQVVPSLLTRAGGSLRPGT